MDAQDIDDRTTIILALMDWILKPNRGNPHQRAVALAFTLGRQEDYGFKTMQEAADALGCSKAMVSILADRAAESFGFKQADRRGGAKSADRVGATPR